MAEMVDLDFQTFMQETGPFVMGVLEDVLGESLLRCGFEIDAAQQPREGYAADRVVLTCTCTTRGWQQKKRRVFIKRQRIAGRCEALHYRGLTESGAPVPRLYGVTETDDHREFLVLEHLRHAGDREAPEAFIELIARFNAVQPVPAYRKQLATHDFQVELQKAPEVLATIWHRATRGDLGSDLKALCTYSPQSLSRLQDFATSCIGPIAKMEKGLIHTDLRPENTGRKTSRSRPLVVDLAEVCLGPRFFDIGRWLGCPPVDRASRAWQSEMANVYLGYYPKRDAPSRDQFKVECRILWATATLSMLWFWLDRAVDGWLPGESDRQAGRRVCRERLHDQLASLLVAAARLPLNRRRQEA